MADYPVRDGLGNVIVAGYQVDPSALVGNNIAGQYPTKDGLGNTIIPDRGIVPKAPPVRADTSGRTVISSYPVKNGAGQTTGATPTNDGIPAGQVMIVDADNAPLLDADGAFLMEPT